VHAEKEEARTAMTKHTPGEAKLVRRLLEIIAAEGLVSPDLLEPHATVDDIGLSLDDLTLIGNAIEREFDCDMMPDEEMQACTTVRELVGLIGRRLQDRAASNR
jgi:acyl carrier protein